MDENNVVTNFIDKFKKLNTNAKIIILSGVTVCIVAVGAGFLYTGKTEESALFTNLTASDASEVTTILDELATEYTIKENKDNTINIFVPEDDVAVARMEVSSKFTPSDGNVVGYEILDTTSFGETQSDRETKRIRALEGEITKTLQKIPSITWARVHISVASNSFLDVSNEESTASVTLQLADNATLNKNQVTGVIKIVSNAVEGLQPSNVEVIDTNANLLSSGLFTDSDEYSFNDSEDSLKLTKEKEANISNKISNVLDAVVGKGNSVVSVDLSLNMDKKEINSQILGDKVPISEQELIKETSIGDNSGNIVGADPNSDTEDYVSSETSSQSSSTESYTETITNYEISTTNEKTVVATGSIEKMTISVVVDETSLLDENGNVNETLKSELLNNVKNAAGFSDERDQVSLTVAPFNKDASNEAKESIDKENTQKLISNIVTGVVALAAIATVAILIKKSIESLKNSNVNKNSFNDNEFIANSLTNYSDSISSIDDSIILEERIKKTIDVNTDDAVKAMRYFLNSENRGN